MISMYYINQRHDLKEEATQFFNYETRQRENEEMPICFTLLWKQNSHG